MSRSYTRNQFLKLSAGIATLTLTACGDDGGTDDTTDTTGNGTTGGTSTSTTNGTSSTTNGTSSTTTSTSTTDATTTGMDTGTETGMADTGTGTTTGMNTCANGAEDIDMTNQHLGAEHHVMIPAGDITAAAQKDYDIQGDSDHPHTITVTEEMFMMLQQGVDVMVTSTNDGHMHVVTLSCI